MAGTVVADRPVPWSSDLPERTRQKWRWGWTAAIVLLTLVGCFALLNLWWAAGQQHPTSWLLANETLTGTPLLQADNELTIWVAAGSSTCDRFDGVDVYETDSTVEIRAWMTHNASKACLWDSTMEPVTIQLDAPLGDRTLTGCNPPDAYDEGSVAVNVDAGTLAFGDELGDEANCGAP